MKKAGFTIVELIIAIFLLSIAIIGIFSAFSVMLILTDNASDRLVAAYLAQEGVEVVRNIRDTNWLNMDAGSSSAWNAYLDSCDQGCEVDYKTGTNGPPLIRPWTGNEDYLDLESGFYVYDTVTLPKCSSPMSDHCTTKFKRKITITSLSQFAMKITVQVLWDQPSNLLNPTGAQGSVTAQETIYDWYNYTSAGLFADAINLQHSHGVCL